MVNVKGRQVLEFKTVLNAPAEEVFRWHWKKDTFKKLIPPWEPVELVQPATGPVDGAIAILRMAAGPCKIDWVASHCDFIADRQFVDIQKSGPFAFWRHLHKFEPMADGKCLLLDRIEYELPLSALSQPFVGGFVEAKIKRMFKYRHEITAKELNSLNSIASANQSRTTSNISD